MPAFRKQQCGIRHTWGRPRFHRSQLAPSCFHAVAAAAPVSFSLGPDLIILAGIAYDWRRRGEVHKVWLWGGGAPLASQLLRVAVMRNPLWLAFAQAAAAIW